MENFVLLMGWGTTPDYYKKLTGLAPRNCNFFIPPYESLFKKGSFEEFEPSFLEFLKINQLTKINLIGYSLGGLLAINFTNKYPEKVGKLYLVDSAGIYGNKNVVVQFLNILRESKNRFIIAEFIKFLPRFFTGLPVNFKLGVNTNRCDLQDEAKNIKIPTTIFWGEKDIVTPLWQGEKLQSLIPKSKLVVFKGESHNWFISKPELFWEKR